MDITEVLALGEACTGFGPEPKRRAVAGPVLTRPQDGVPVSDRIWTLCEARQLHLDALAEGRPGNNVWNPDNNLIGPVAEKYHEHRSRWPCGWSEDPADWADDLCDGGEDSPGVDVKGVSNWHNPELMRPVSYPLKAPVYWLCAVDVRRHRVKAVGYATRAMILNATVKPLRVETHVLPGRELLTAEQLIPRLFHEMRSG